MASRIATPQNHERHTSSPSPSKRRTTAASQLDFPSAKAIAAEGFRRPASQSRRRRGSAVPSPSGERISTGVRLRPRLPHERTDSTSEPCVRIEPPSRVVLLDPQQRASRSFDCDVVFDSSDPTSDQYADQGSVYEAVGAPIVDFAAKGFNASLCAYGQTGTGKTHTVVGNWLQPEERGLLPRIARGLFDRVEELQAAGADVRVQASYIEIYNNRLRDVLASASPSTSAQARSGSPQPRSSPEPRDDHHLKIRTHPAVGVFVENLSEIAVAGFEQLGKVVTDAQRSLRTAATSMNSKSSRSHTIFSLKLEVRGGPTNGGHRMATIQVVDLAGRENEDDSKCTGERFRELTFINRSLFQLGNCVHALSDDAREHVPFRNSKLTMLLSESFQQNSRTCLLATLSPNSKAYDDNLLTCRFLESTGRITTQPVANRFCSEDLRGQLEDELEKMHRTLGLDKLGNPPAGVDMRQKEQVALQTHKALLRQVTQGLTQVSASSEGTNSDSKEALLVEACARADATLGKAQDSLASLDQANASVDASLGKAESHLSALETILQEMRRTPTRARSARPPQRSSGAAASSAPPSDAIPRGNASGRQFSLPPLMPASRRVIAEDKPCKSSFNISISLPPLVVL